MSLTNDQIVDAIAEKSLMEVMVLVKGGYTPDVLTQTGGTSGTSGGPTYGGYEVNEAYVELQVPILSNMPGARLLEIVSRHANPSATLNALPTSHSTPEINVPCAEGEPHRLTATLQTLAANAFAGQPQVSINTIDGVRIDWPDGFGLIRASNTTPVLVLRFEGHTNEALQRIQSSMLALLHQVKPDAALGAAAH